VRSGRGGETASDPTALERMIGFQWLECGIADTGMIFHFIFFCEHSRNPAFRCPNQQRASQTRGERSLIRLWRFRLRWATRIEASKTKGEHSQRAEEGVISLSEQMPTVEGRESTGVRRKKNTI